MKVQDIKEIAQKMAIHCGKLKKGELIRLIQVTEGNNACFDSGQSSQCGQQGCLWAEDCN
ncbi:SAP domain-containing protein [Geomonas sp. Red69]|uniref:SAP domain-containing protein n=1 Tax=Geomonas diazotrophica TaxID=2843197 RepID=A0ABX8JIN7_9BACT|nr:MULTISPECIES: SAP domain-containing protein [Geomonas]MBU5635449.1 SAP domain-containing protein [Geomonas diazotrophica]QWV97499.1 SAP domain-containing protein [Geomonas nitrogeniifigens]QXE86638.1 SAP domain-containing protein [Geomonas nitrogeniifigens]